MSHNRRLSFLLYFIVLITLSTTVSINAQVKPNGDPIYAQLRNMSDSLSAFSGDYAVVNNLILQRDAGTFTLKSGEIYFLAPVEGRTVGAVFIGDGEFYMTPPVEAEKKSLSIFVDAPEIKEEFTNLVLHFTDKTLEEIKGSPNVQMKTGGQQAIVARELYRSKEEVWREKIHYNIHLRTLADIYKPQRQGFFAAFINGKRFSKLLYRVDSIGLPFVAPEQVTLESYGITDSGIWASFHKADEHKRGTATSNQDRRLFDITSHKVDCRIRAERLIITDKISLTARLKNERVIPLDLFGSLRVTRVLDSQGKELNFIQENEDNGSDFGIVLPEPTQLGDSYTLTVEYSGDEALQKEGIGNFILHPLARSNWYPNNAASQFGDRAFFEITFRYPKSYTLIGVGTLVEEEKVEGDLKVSKWTGGTSELAVAGFNYGDFKKKSLTDNKTGYGIEVYVNKELPSELKAFQKIVTDTPIMDNTRGGTTFESLSTTGMIDVALSEAQNSMRVYDSFFGKLPYQRVALSQQPAGSFGQAWPTLIFMPYFAYIPAAQRVELFGTKSGADTFWQYVGPHEIAHQWWGHTIGWASYRDQWMSEGFSEFSASLYVQLVRQDMNKFIDFWNAQRRLIVESSAQAKGRKPYTIGALTQGYRLNNAKTGDVARSIIYPKGAYVLHMIRMMMYDSKTGDEKFRAMMQDFVKTYYNTDVSTEDFKRIIEKHILPHMDFDKNRTMNWFFDQWVYGTEIPAYNFEYQIGKTEDGKAVLTGKITQSGVSNNFAMVVPIYVDFGKGWTRLGSIGIVGNSTFDLKDIILPQMPEKAAICVLNDILATSIQNKKR